MANSEQRQETNPAFYSLFATRYSLLLAQQTERTMRLLIVGTLEGQLTLATKLAMEKGATVTHAEDIEQALRVLRSGRGADLLMVDVAVNIRDLVARLENEHIHAPIVACGTGTDARAAVAAIHAGAKEYIPLPPDPELIAAVLAAVADDHREFIYRDEAMAQVAKLAQQIAPSDASVMITGESGTGKEVLARYVHARSNRARAPFICVNCAAIPENLLESELFGHEKGAFTGAVAQRIGRFELANGGTIFLDEIADMSSPLQAKLLRVTQEGRFSRVGGNETVRTDVRLIAATHKTLEQEVAKKQFREDLFYRLNVVRIHLPPLRQRREDVNLLAEYFLKKIATQKHLPQLKLSEEAVKLMEEYPWPGNVRELENTIQRACVLATSDVLLPKDIPLGAATQQSDGTSENLAVPVNHNPVKPTLETAVEILLDAASTDRSLQLLPWLEREFTLFAMKRTKGNQVKAAKLLGVTRATLRKRIERYGITKELNFQ